MHKSYQFQS